MRVLLVRRSGAGVTHPLLLVPGVGMIAQQSGGNSGAQHVELVYASRSRDGHDLRKRGLPDWLARRGDGGQNG